MRMLLLFIRRSLGVGGLLLLPLICKAQDHINLMNGQILEGRVLGQSSLEIRYLEPRINTYVVHHDESLDTIAKRQSVTVAQIKFWNGLSSDSIQPGQRLRIQRPVPKGKHLIERDEPTESVFSVIDSLGREKVWYFHDTLFGNDLSLAQMRWYLNGERDARKGYKPLLPEIGGFLAGAGIVIALDLEVNSLIIPPAYAGLMAWPRVNVTRGSINDPNMEGDPSYAMGYSAVARPKRVIRCLISSFAGIVVGVAVRQLIINPNVYKY